MKLQLNVFESLKNCLLNNKFDEYNKLLCAEGTNLTKKQLNELMEVLE